MLLIVPSYYPEIRGGAERQATILAEALRNLGAEIVVVAPTLTANLQGWATAPFGKILRLYVQAHPARGGRYILSTLGWAWKLSQWMVDHRDTYDLAYAFHARLNVLGPLLGSWRARKPLVVKPGGGGVNSDFNALRAKRFIYGQIVLQLLLRWTKVFVAVSSAIIEDLTNEGVDPSRIFHLSNGVVVPDEASMRSALASRAGNRLIFPTRLVGDKGIEVLISALSLVHDCELTLLGEGPDKTRLEALATERGVRDRVHFIDAVDDVFPILKQHDLFISASEREGQSNALLEAIAWGLIPVVAPASGVRDLVHPGENGFIVAKVEPSSFAAAIQQVLDLPSTEKQIWSWRLHEQAQKTVRIEFIAEQLLDRFSAIVRST